MILKRNQFFPNLLKLAPIILLYISVLNEFDFNYIKYFSFNFPFILIYYWSLKRSESLGYGYIFIAGLINDVVVGLPIGFTSINYLLICGFAAYLRNITLSRRLNVRNPKRDTLESVAFSLKESSLYPITW